MYFFESTPVGRLINLFSKDIDTIDFRIPRVIDLWLERAFDSLVIIMIVAYASPYFLIALSVLLIPYFFIQVNLNGNLKWFMKLYVC